jgi:hypothetical protein
LSATSTVSGAGFTARFAAPGPIGSTTPSTVAATTVTASGTITPAQVAGIVGTTTNNNAQAGSVGEYVTATQALTAAVSGTVTNLTSISLTAGDWDVQGTVHFVPAGTTVIAGRQGSLSTTTGTLGPIGSATLFRSTLAAGLDEVFPTPTVRFSLTATTTVFIVYAVVFTTSTCQVEGIIRARRVR